MTAVMAVMPVDKSELDTPRQKCYFRYSVAEIARIATQVGIEIQETVI